MAAEKKIRAVELMKGHKKVKLHAFYVEFLPSFTYLFALAMFGADENPAKKRIARLELLVEPNEEKRRKNSE